MKYARILLFALLASLAFSSGLRAQYRWRVIQPAKVDTSFYGFNAALASYGHSCVAVGASSSQNNATGSYFTMTSTDDGITWAKHYLPSYFDTLEEYEIQDIQMVDSLTVYAITDSYFWRSSDGGATWGAELFGKDNWHFHFSSAAEGIVTSFNNDFWTTSDSGNSWNHGVTAYSGASNCRSDGGGKFRILSKLLYTTTDYGKTVTSSFLEYLPGSEGDTGFHISFFKFGGGDTIMAFCVHANPPGSGYHTFVYVSSDSGVDWTEQTMLDTNYSIIPFVATSVDSPTVFVGNYPPEIITYTTDHGATWQTDTTLGDDSLPNEDIMSITLAGSKNAVAIIPAIDIDTIVVNGQSYPISGSVLARLELIPSSVSPGISVSKNLVLYPNPTSNILTLSSSSGTISILDPLGRSYAVKQTVNSLDISSLPPGVYFVSDGASRAKFVKE